MRPTTCAASPSAADHGAYSQKEMLKRYLEELGYRVVDVGCFSAEKVDYPDIAAAVCRKVVSGDCERGIVLDGAGIGSCMAANKVRGIRAAMCYDLRTVINSREHNNANVLSLGGPLHDAGSCARWRRCGLPRGSAADGTWCG